MKNLLLTGWVGEAALSLRNRMELMRTAYSRVAEVACVANDQLATHLVTAICQPYKTFVDVGAHIGSILFQVARNDGTVKIVAIEATPEKATRLRRKFPNIELFACAAGESSGELTFFVHSDRTGYNSLIEPERQDGKSVAEIKVPVKRLDELVPSQDVNVIKIDVEGAELGVLRGSSGLLSRCRPTIMFESGPEQDSAFGYTLEALYGFFASNDYAVLVPNRVAHNDPGLSVEGFLESHLYPRRTTNYFAVPKEQRGAVRDRARSILGIRVAQE